MEKGVLVVSEFNPFHKGHLWLFRKIREKFPEKPIVCVMSSDFVQRGDVAVMDKYSRAKCAVLCGADLVLELPFPYSALSAESFAYNAVNIARLSGMVSHIAFGTEIPDVGKIYECARNINSEKFLTLLDDRRKTQRAEGYAFAREAVYTDLFGKTDLFSLPNSSLAVEYAAAIIRTGAGFELFPVMRKGAGLNEEKPRDGIASASYIRKKLSSGGIDSVREFLPEAVTDVMLEEKNAGRFPATLGNLDKILEYLVISTPVSRMKELYSVSAFAERLKAIANDIHGTEDLVEKLKNRKYTDSRARRGAVSLICGIPRSVENTSALYSVILAASISGTALLSEYAEDSKIPIFTKPSAVLSCENGETAFQGRRAFEAERIYVLSMPGFRDTSYSLKKSPFIKK